MLRVTADTNIYISALNFGGPPDQVLSLARAGVIQLAITQAILDEIARVLDEKFGWADDGVRRALERIADFSDLVTTELRLDVVREDPADNRILECAAAAESGYLVTGDRHLLKLGRHGEIRILPPAEFLAIVADLDQRR